jgi:hypothetical protein
MLIRKSREVEAKMNAGRAVCSPRSHALVQSLQPLCVSMPHRSICRLERSMTTTAKPTAAASESLEEVILTEWQADLRLRQWSQMQQQCLVHRRIVEVMRTRLGLSPSVLYARRARPRCGSRSRWPPSPAARNDALTKALPASPPSWGQQQLQDRTAIGYSKAIKVV